MSFGGDLRAVLAQPHFPRLYATRLVSQLADGVFQAGLAGAVLFSPERETDARRVAAGFVVLLLPYSLIGPFAGVFLDRWRRQRVLVHANLVRAALLVSVAVLLVGGGASGPLFYVTALAVISVNRFYLAALSAALPHVVREPWLIMGNSVTTTSGTLVAILGGGLGLGVRSLAGHGDGGSAVVALTAAAVCLVSSAVATGLDADLLGPDHAQHTPLRSTLAQVAGGFAAGTRHLAERRNAAYALLAITAHRFFFGLSTVATLLLYRNYFTDSGFFRSGLVGLGQVFVAAGIGTVAAAAATPELTPRLGKQHWLTGLFAAAAVVEIGLALPFTMPALLMAALLLGFVAQGSKISVDTIVQETVDDDYRGRVFSVYDTLFNLAFVTAAVVAALMLPATGRSPALVFLVAAGYALTAFAYGAAVRELPEPGSGAPLAPLPAEPRAG